MALQQPLTQLYLKYLAKDEHRIHENVFGTNHKNGQSPITLPGSIEISKTGLKVRIISSILFENNGWLTLYKKY